MPRFKAGDRVQLVGDIARFYSCLVGVITSSGSDSSFVLVQYQVRLADDTVGAFFDFQLQSPPPVRAQVVFDSTVSEENAGTRGPSTGRHVQLVATGVELHLKLSDSSGRSLIGQVTVGKTALCRALVTLLNDDQVIATKATGDTGEFEFSELPAGTVVLEATVPGKRIVASLNI